MKTIIIADGHLKGTGDPHMKTLVDFLDSFSGPDGVSGGSPADVGGAVINRLIILGDLFEFWTDFKETVYSRYFPVLAALHRLARQGVEIVYVEGNHDFNMGSFFTGELGARVSGEFYEFEDGGRRFFVGHGDTIKCDLMYRLWRWFVRIKPVSWIFKGLLNPAFALRLGIYLSGRSRAYGEERGRKIERNLSAFATRKIADGMDVVLMGHSHVAGIHEIEVDGRRGTYANPGSWTDGSYLILEDGKITLERFKG